MVWSAYGEEERRIERGAVAGALPTQATSRPEIGMYVDDTLGNKLGYYLDYRVDVSSGSCGGGRQTLKVRLTAKSAVPPHAKLTPSVLRARFPGLKVGTLVNSYSLYAPVGGELVSATLDGHAAPMNRYTYRGRQVGFVSLSLKPGHVRHVDYVLESGPGQTGQPHVIMTPGARGLGTGQIGQPL